jgi:hypothetical protein
MLTVPVELGGLTDPLCSIPNYVVRSTCQHTDKFVDPFELHTSERKHMSYLSPADGTTQPVE